ncbi:protein ABHD8-like [Convolutriloba macropyga]|uniref:protein ABHD8-like n=1 Tax=Convolutriloba macropyga TaxID=536237 RepID=UPI003F51AE14
MKCGCCDFPLGKKKSAAKVSPGTVCHVDYDVLEARPNRFIRVRHENIRTRTEKQDPATIDIEINTEYTTSNIDSTDIRASVSEKEGASSSGPLFEVSDRKGLGYDAPSLKSPLGSRDHTQWLLFFVHGVASSSNDWSQQLEHFKQLGFRCVAVDLLGHGGSTSNVSSDHPSSSSAKPEASKRVGKRRKGQKKSDDYSFKQMAADVLAVFDHYAHSSGNVLIGHSLGCSICTYVAAKRPYAVSKLCLLCGGGPEVLNGMRGNCCCGHCDILCLPNCLFSLFRPCCYSYVKKQLFSEVHLQSTRDLRASIDDVSPDVIKYTLRGQIWMEGNEAFHEALRVQCQLIGGTNDLLVDDDDEINMFNTLKLCRLDMIVGASHMLMIENAHLVNCLIEEFLKEPISAKADFAKFNFRQMETSANEHNDHSLDAEAATDSDMQEKVVFYHKS